MRMNVCRSNIQFSRREAPAPMRAYCRVLTARNPNRHRNKQRMILIRGTGAGARLMVQMEVRAISDLAKSYTEKQRA